MTAPTPEPESRPPGGRWIEHWNPADPGFWERTGQKIGIVGAVGAQGGLFINLAFRESFQAAGTDAPAWSASR